VDKLKNLEFLDIKRCDAFFERSSRNGSLVSRVFCEFVEKDANHLDAVHLFFLLNF